MAQNIQNKFIFQGEISRKAKTKRYSVKRQKGKISMRNAPFLVYFIYLLYF